MLLDSPLTVSHVTPSQPASPCSRIGAAAHDTSPSDRAGVREANSRDIQERLAGRRIDGAGRKAQLHLRADADFAPHRQLASHQRGPLWHAAQSIVPLDPLAGEHRRVDALAIVTTRKRNSLSS